ncbi:MAG: chorismate mutase [Oligoflexia bacterium]|nr:chorismate mutase [Oligoflexia bacterium]
MNKLAKNKISKIDAQKLEQLRKKIDLIDHHILKLIGQRLKIAKKMGTIKIRNKMPLLQKNRLAHILKERSCFARHKHKIPSTFTNKLISLLHQLSLNHQKQLHKK